MPTRTTKNLLVLNAKENLHQVRTKTANSIRKYFLPWGIDNDSSALSSGRGVEDSMAVKI